MATLSLPITPFMFMSVLCRPLRSSRSTIRTQALTPLELLRRKVRKHLQLGRAFSSRWLAPNAGGRCAYGDALSVGGCLRGCREMEGKLDGIVADFTGKSYTVSWWLALT